MRKLVKNKLLLSLWIIFFFLLFLRILLAFLGIPLCDVADFLFNPEQIEVWAWVASLYAIGNELIRIFCPGVILISSLAYLSTKVAKLIGKGQKKDG